MVTPQPHRPDKTLWCEFVELLDCHATFVLDNQDGWIQHHADHLQDTFPSEFCCWFCDGLTFEAPNPTDGHAAFMSRMEHIRQHIFDDPHLTIAQMRPDLNMVERLSFPQRPNHSIDAELALDGLRQFHPVPEGGPDAPVGGLQAPFTDSGYASVLPGRCVSAGTEDKEEDDGDTKTEISAASKAIGPEAQRPISEVSNDIYNQVQRHLDDDNKTLVLGALPNLIKAFAIRLAHLDPSDTSRRIMHFIYSRHQ
ncbi:hypothetical protein C8A05DRAFT_19332 [Staphylotrichum tortipilum]|uniref:Uncharacterized protein n=1 Tax=Staphylotrichum tortipilum TaxID=2831512 RepID=A0AAN6RQ40_9PEZI|nr:hypothetical protein C8A05DRAFT_19332 [Staphylotrichum longicolle]